MTSAKTQQQWKVFQHLRALLSVSGWMVVRREARRSAGALQQLALEECVVLQRRTEEGPCLSFLNPIHLH